MSMILNIGAQFQQVNLFLTPSKIWIFYFNYIVFFLLGAKNLIDHLLVVDRHKRMRADEILIHPWIISIGQSKPLRNTEETRAALRLKYESKSKEYAAENSGPWFKMETNKLKSDIKCQIFFLPFTGFDYWSFIFFLNNLSFNFFVYCWMCT